jgi:hypothetical protein
LKFSNDGRFLFSCGQDCKIIVWEKVVDEENPYVKFAEIENVNEMGILDIDYYNINQREFIISVNK